ncbi:MAG: phosphodiesterase [Sphingomonas sp. 28-66-16]|nr:MAG: phosphodiesterase [Sphingomonas sp. 28-66-16]
MLIAQITDLHLGFEPDNPAEDNRRRLDAVLDQLIDGPNRPDLLLATGDLTDRGDPESFARLVAILRRCPFPVYPMLGNHDDRAAFAAAFPQVPLADGFAQYCLSRDGLRLILLDTLEAGRHGGSFCAVRAAWLAARLAEQPTTPTVILMHHPPIDAGIAWMAADQGTAFTDRFAATIGGHRQIIAIWCGHLHRAVSAPWNGITVSICPATAAQLSLDLSPIDPENPDGRPMVNDDPPGYALHRWDGAQLVSHVDTVRPRAALARFDDRMQPLVRQLFAERE